MSGQIEFFPLGLDDLLQDGIALVTGVGKQRARRVRRRRLTPLEPGRLRHGGGRMRETRTLPGADGAAIGSVIKSTGYDRPPDRRCRPDG